MGNRVKNSGTPVVLFVVALFLTAVACGQPAEEWELRGWTATPSVVAQATQTPIIVKETVEVVAQQTVELIVQVTPTPSTLCVVAHEAVYLRPSADESGYPILPLPNGSQVQALGGRDNGFLFVRFRGKQGWVYGSYIGDC